MIPALLVLLACGPDEEATAPAAPEPVPETPSTVTVPASPAPPSPTTEAPSEPSSGTAPTITGSGVPVELQFFGVGPLHKGFFTDPEAVTALSRALGPCVEGTAQVRVRWDAEERIGRLRLKVPPDGLTCLPVTTDEGWDLSPLEPVGRALAAYRDRVAGAFDYRLASFRLGVSFTRGSHQCVLKAAGQHPPDGTRWSPCVDFAGVERCGEGSREDGVTTLSFADERSRRDLAACFSR